MSEIIQETIAAISTAPGRGGIGVVRLSGPLSKEIAEQITRKKIIPRQAIFSTFLNNQQQILDEGLVLYFNQPHSFTGEEVVELQAHGSPIVLNQLLECAVLLGARLAKPGEFSERAFLNKKIDLAQAEAIADLIHATSTQAARSAVRSLQGDFSKKIHEILKELIYLRMYCEAALDFPDEEVDFLKDQKIVVLLNQLQNHIEQLLSQAKQGALLQSGITLVIVGKPNAGKSSLLNALSERPSAIVTEIAGTTRDILRENIDIDGLPVHIIDTAGLRDSEDIIEKEGIRRAYLAMQEADFILWVQDILDQENRFDDQIPKNIPRLKILNKIDLVHETAEFTVKNNETILKMSAKNQEGIALLKHYLKEGVGYKATEENTFIARQRHVEALKEALSHIEHGQHQLQQYHAGEFLAEDLHQAQQALNKITGEFTSDDLLGVIFSSFCIGK